MDVVLHQTFAFLQYYLKTQRKLQQYLMPTLECHRPSLCFETIFTCIIELCSELFFSFGVQTKGDVHGGGEGVQH